LSEFNQDELEFTAIQLSTSPGSVRVYAQKKSAARGSLSPPPVLISTVFCSLP